MAFGVSQIDAGSRIETGRLHRGRRRPGDGARAVRAGRHPLAGRGDARAADDGYIPSFCTACYRLGRTGEHFMEFAIPGFIQNFCTPNALTTLMEYLVDYASPETRAAGEADRAASSAKLPDGPTKQRAGRAAASGSRRPTSGICISETASST